jgi:hypothetical protein
VSHFTVNQLTSQPVNQLTSQPVNQSTSPPVNQLPADRGAGGRGEALRYIYLFVASGTYRTRCQILAVLNSGKSPRDTQRRDPKWPRHGPRRGRSPRTQRNQAPEGAEGEGGGAEPPRNHRRPRPAAQGKDDKPSEPQKNK